MALIDATPSDPAMVFAAEPLVKMMSLVTMLALTKEHLNIRDCNLLSTACPTSNDHGTVGIVFVLSVRDTYRCCFFIGQASFELCSPCLAGLGTSKDHISSSIKYCQCRNHTCSSISYSTVHKPNLMKCSQSKIEPQQRDDITSSLNTNVSLERA